MTLQISIPLSIFLIIVIVFLIPIGATLILIVISIVYMFILRRLHNGNIIRNFDNSHKFVGVIIGKRETSGIRSLAENIHLYSNSISFLLTKLNRLKLNYKVIFVSKGIDFEKSVLNRNMESIFIISHGCEYGIRLNDGLYRYRRLGGKLQDKKLFTAQLHCNKPDTESYPREKSDVSMRYFSTNSYIKDTYRNSITNTWYILIHFPKRFLYRSHNI